ncbi:MAG: 3-oxoacyl-ACP reductase FabG [Aerococcus sp.]|nr:3-oxoacyl-ACP reductase FabG [Aerococcus sp.]
MAEQKVAIVTGGGKGIGLAVSKRLLADGCFVVINSHHELSEEALDELSAYEGSYANILGSVTEEKDVKRLVDETADKYGHIDILVNNAGITRDMLFPRMKSEDFQAVINTNLFGTFLMSKYAFKKMQRARTGVIINIASIVGLHGNMGQANYAASKAGVIGLTKTIAREGARHGVRANAIAPGMIKTQMIESMNDRRQQEILDNVPLGHFGTPENIADTVSFLVNNDYITGQIITVDGGVTI